MRSLTTRRDQRRLGIAIPVDLVKYVVPKIIVGEQFRRWAAIVMAGQRPE
jgi:S1-C subfamily serine protease